MIQEKQLCRFKLTYMLEDQLLHAEVHQIDMGGWVMFECFLLPDYSVVHIACENEGMYYLDMEDDIRDHANAIVASIKMKLN